LKAAYHAHHFSTLVCSCFFRSIVLANLNAATLG